MLKYSYKLLGATQKSSYCTKLYILLNCRINMYGKMDGSGYDVLMCYASICLDDLRKTMKNLSQDSISFGWDFNPGPPKYTVYVYSIKGWI